MILGQGAAPTSAYVSVGVLSAFLVFPSGMLLAVIFRTVESWSTYSMRQRRRVQRVQESVAVKEAMDFVPREQAASGTGSASQTRQVKTANPKPSPPTPSSGAPSFTRRSAGLSPASPAAGNARTRDIGPRSPLYADSVSPVTTTKPARTPVKRPLGKLSSNEKESAGFAPVRMRKAMQSGAPPVTFRPPTSQSVGVAVKVSRPPEPRRGPARPRAVPAGSGRRPGEGSLTPPDAVRGERELHAVRDYLPRRLFGMKGGGDKTPQPAPSGSRRDKSGRRKARRDPGPTLQMDRLLPIAEMDENSPWPPHLHVPHSSKPSRKGTARCIALVH